MPRQIQVTLYQFDELSDKAKDRARQWYRETSDSDWSEYVLEDAAQCAAILGIAIDPGKIYWNFGDGASFDGTYAVKADAPKAIRDHAPLDETLHQIADDLATVPACYTAKTLDCQGMLGVELDPCEEGTDLEFIQAEKAIRDALRRFADWIYDRLRAENDYQNEDAQIDDAIRANEYEFTENGRLA